MSNDTVEKVQIYRMADLCTRRHLVDDDQNCDAVRITPLLLNVIDFEEGFSVNGRLSRQVLGQNQAYNK